MRPNEEPSYLDAETAQEYINGMCALCASMEAATAEQRPGAPAEPETEPEDFRATQAAFDQRHTEIDRQRQELIQKHTRINELMAQLAKYLSDDASLAQPRADYMRIYNTYVEAGAVYDTYRQELKCAQADYTDCLAAYDVAKDKLSSADFASKHLIDAYYDSLDRFMQTSTAVAKASCTCIRVRDEYEKCQAAYLLAQSVYVEYLANAAKAHKAA